MEEIKHEGRIASIEPDFTTVEILSKSACSACHAAGLCGMSEYTKKEIMVKTSPFDNYKVGENVDVILSQTMGLKAVWISYAIPLIILVFLILSLSLARFHELFVGLFSIAGVGLYYFGVYLFKDKLAKEYVFTIRPHKD